MQESGWSCSALSPRLGRVVDALGTPIDGAGPIKTTTRRRVELKVRASKLVGRDCNNAGNIKNMLKNIQTDDKLSFLKCLVCISIKRCQAPGIIPRQSVHEPMTVGRWRGYAVVCWRKPNILGYQGLRAKTEKQWKTKSQGIFKSTNRIQDLVVRWLFVFSDCIWLVLPDFLLLFALKCWVLVGFHVFCLKMFSFLCSDCSNCSVFVVVSTHWVVFVVFSMFSCFFVLFQGRWCSLVFCV